MSDIILKCEHCLKHLVAGNANIGATFSCPDCSGAVVVPMPDISFVCPSCNHDLSSSYSEAGVEYDCPECGRVFKIPNEKPNFQLKIKAVEHRNITCGFCRNEIPEDSEQCPLCSNDARGHSALGRESQSHLRKNVAVPILAIVAVCGTFIYFILPVFQSNKTTLTLSSEDRYEEEGILAEIDLVSASLKDDVVVEITSVYDHHPEPEVVHTPIVVDSNDVSPDVRESIYSRLVREFFSENDINVVRNRVLSTVQGNILDEIVKLSKKMDIRISIDRNILDELSIARIDVNALTSIQAIAQLEQYLKQINPDYIIRRVALREGSSETVQFITSEPAWRYLRASWLADQMRYEEALALLAPSKSKGRASLFDHHCNALADMLTLTTNNELAIYNLTASVSDAANRFDAAVRSLDPQGPSVVPLRGGPFERERRGREQREAVDRQQAIIRDIHRQWNRLNIQYQDFARSNDAADDVVLSRLVECLNNRLFLEAGFLLRYMKNIQASMERMFAEVKRVDIGFHADDEEFRITRREWIDSHIKLVEERTATAASMRSALTIGSSDRDLTSARIRSTISSAIDQSSVHSLASAGYFRFAEYSEGLNRVQSGSNYSSISEREKMLEQIRSLGKLRLARAISDLWELDMPNMAEAPATIGRATGLVVSEKDIRGVTDIFISSIADEAAIDNIKRHQRINTSGWLPALSDARSTTPVLIDGYGGVDQFMWQSIIQVFHWLSRVQSAEMIGKGLRVSYHNINIGLGGDSAGATMAIASRSALLRHPIAGNTAMTGSIRMDGTIHPVGGIYEKVMGAEAEEMIEVVLIPKANEPDMMLVPYDVLCRLTVITANHIDAYIKYTDPTNENASTALDIMSKAQAHLLAGQHDVAAEYLLYIAVKHPYIYNAKRLLQMAHNWR